MNGTPRLMDVDGCEVQSSFGAALRKAGMNDSSDCLDKIDITRHPLYEKLARQAEDADAIDAGNKLELRPAIWGGHAEFRRAVHRPAKGQRFIIAFEILTCHACHSAGFAEIAYDFDGAGRFLGTTLVGLVPPHQKTMTMQRGIKRRVK